MSKSISTTKEKTNCTHPRVRSTYRSLSTNIPYLFTYKNHKNHKNITIHNTTNAIDGGVFFPMKKLQNTQWIYKKFKVKNG